MILKHKRKFDDDYSLEEFPRSAGKLFFSFLLGKDVATSLFTRGKHIWFSTRVNSG